MENESPSQEPATFSYPEPEESTLLSISSFFKIYLMLPSFLCLDLPSRLFPSGLHAKIPYASLISFKRNNYPAISCIRLSAW